MSFNYIMHKDRIGHYWGPHGNIFAPPPKKKQFIEKKWTIYMTCVYSLSSAGMQSLLDICKNN